MSTKVVAIGGGHGLANSLRAIRRYAETVTAVVSVADDGGSSGRLRDALGTIPPGDLRKCLVALGDERSVWGTAFEHRFAGGELLDHALGNLIIAGLASSTGDVIEGLDEAARLLDCVGRVLPATSVPVVLQAEADDGPVEGQVAVSGTDGIRRVSIVPGDAEVPDDVVKAIASADQLVIGPGSLYTSVLAALCVPGIRAAVADSSATKVYVCNLRPQLPETAGYTVADHVDALARHGVRPDVVLYDAARIERGTLAFPAVAGSLTDGVGDGHDPERLAAALADRVG